MRVPDPPLYATRNPTLTKLPARPLVRARRRRSALSGGGGIVGVGASALSEHLRHPTPPDGTPPAPAGGGNTTMPNTAISGGCLGYQFDDERS